MIPRDPRRPRAAAIPFAPAGFPARLLTLLLLLVAPVLASAVLAPDAAATVESVAAIPMDPATCDSVTLRGVGSMSVCDYLASAEVFGPEPMPEVAGPLPAYRTRIEFVVRRDSMDVPCVALAFERYTRDFPMGRLPMGHHVVTAIERVYDENGVLRDSSRVGITFFVSPNDSCAIPSCVLLGFAPPGEPAPAIACDAVAVPGGEGCFDVALMNPVPVSGVQLKIRLTDEQGVPVPAGAFTPKSVTAAPRADGFQAAWEADGSDVSIILFSATDALIPAGRGPILRVCYSVGSRVPRRVYRLTFERALVAGPDGNELPQCPTFRQEAGRFCVGGDACDVNGDGAADVLDIIRLVRCALAGDACPDSIAARSDCNGDGSIDVRDVICCVRRLLLIDRQSMIEPPAIANPTRIGFDGPAVWLSPSAGRADVDVVPAADFGAIDFDIEPAPNVRITGVRLGSGAGLRLEWAVRDDRRARVLLLRDGEEAAPAPVRIWVDFEPLPDRADGGPMRIVSAQSATWDAAAAPFLVTAWATPIQPAPVAAPRIYAARPNPFGGTTEIPFALPAPARVSVRVYDVAGRLVRTLLDATRPEGAGRAEWDGKDAAGRSVPAGVYFVKLTTPGGERTARMIKMR